MVWSICGYRTYCILVSSGIIGCCPIGKLCSGPAGNSTMINVSSPTQTLNLPPTAPVDSLPPPAPTIDSVLPPAPSFNPPPRELVYIARVSQCTYYILNFNLTPASSTAVPVPTFTLRPLPTITTSSSSLGNTASTSSPPRLSAAGRAQLYQPLLFFFGILLAVIYWTLISAWGNMAFKQFDALVFGHYGYLSESTWPPLPSTCLWTMAFFSPMICAMTVISFLSVLRFVLYELGILQSLYVLCWILD